MEQGSNALLSFGQLAARWNRTETALSLATAVGVGPHYVKSHGQIMFSLDEVQKYERACLFFDPAEVALQSVH